jgi:hypothetical protein
MTMFEFEGRVVGWSPDDEPEWEYDEWRWGDTWHPVLDGKLTILLPIEKPREQPPEKEAEP